MVERQWSRFTDFQICWLSLNGGSLEPLPTWHQKWWFLCTGFYCIDSSQFLFVQFLSQNLSFPIHWYYLLFSCLNIYFLLQLRLAHRHMLKLRLFRQLLFWWNGGYVFMISLKSVPWTLAEFYFNRGLQRPYCALASNCKKRLTGFFVCVLFFLKVKQIS